MEYNKKYDLTIKGLGEEDIKASFTSKSIEDSWTLEIDAPKAIKADGTSTEVVKFRLLDAEGKVDTNANDIVLDLNATFGNLSQKRVTIQKGEAEVILRSEFNEAEVVSKIDAQIIEASGNYKDLIGKVVAKSAYVVFNHEGTDGGEEAIIKSLVSVNSNEADRVTLIFDEPILAKDIYKLKDNGEIVLDAEGYPELTDNIKISQDSELTNKKTIKALEISSKNPKAVIAYLDVRGKGKDKNILTDNKDVYVSAKIGEYGSEEKKSFKLTDARTPNITSVDALSNRQLEVVFSEGILSSDFVIDGRFEEEFDVEYGEVVWNPKTNKYVDNRHKVEITLNSKYQEPDKVDGDYVYPKGYFKPGKHSIQASTIKDFAAYTDKNNIGTTQTLSFTVAEDNSEIEVTRTVDSPEQFRVKFNKDIKIVNENKSDDLDAGNVTTRGLDARGFESIVSLNYKDSKGEWQQVEDNIGKYFKGEKEEDDLLYITALGDGEYLVELTTDWTVIYNTKETRDNYYNDTFALIIDEKSVMNPSNGKVNQEPIVVELSKGTALAKPDTTSPEIAKGGIVKAENFDENKGGGFNVTMTEPVKLYSKDNGTLNTEGATLAQKQVELPETKVEFLGRDKDGKTRTLIGKVVGFADKLDKVIRVEWDNGNEEVVTRNGEEKTEVVTPQTIVNDGGDTSWELVIRSISDDIGNTAATVTETFELEPTKEVPVEKEFRVVPENGTALGQDGKGTFAVTGKKTDEEDEVIIEFTQPVATVGNGSAVDVKNYTLNGKDLPAGTRIVLDIDQNEEGRVVKILLPKGTFENENEETGVIKLAEQLKSAEGLELKGDVAFTFEIEDEAEKAKEALEEAIADAEEVAKNEALKGEAKKALDEAITKAEEVAKKENATVKETNEAKKALDKAIADAKAEVAEVEAAKKAVDELFNGEELAEGVDADKISAAKELVEKLEDGDTKTELLEKIEKAKEALAKAEAEKAAKDAVEGLFNGEELAEGVDADKISAAKELVEKLEDGDTKTELLEKIEKAKEALEKAE